MLKIGDWSFARVVLVALAWVVLVVGWQALQFYRLFRRMRTERGHIGSGGIGAVSIGVSGIASVLFGPPLVLLLVWVVLR